MTNFIVSSLYGSKTVSATKYNVTPRSAPFVAMVDGVKADAWTTEGRGSFYIYFKQGDDLYYAKMAGPEELVAARQGVTIQSEEYAAKFAAADKPKAPARKRVVKVKAKA